MSPKKNTKDTDKESIVNLFLSHPFLTTKQKLVLSSALNNTAKPDPLPSRFEMIKNLAQAAKDAIASGLEIRSPEDVEKALNICAVCPKLINDDGWFRCGACGCGIGYAKNPDKPGELSQPAKLGKLAMKAWHCPIGKW